MGSDCLCPVTLVTAPPSFPKGTKPHCAGRGTSRSPDDRQLYNFSIILIQCECLTYLCDFILHLLLRIIDLYLSLLDSSNLPPFLLFHFFSVTPHSSLSSLETLRSIPTMLSVSCTLSLAGDPILYERVRLTALKASSAVQCSDYYRDRGCPG